MKNLISKANNCVNNRDVKQLDSTLTEINQLIQQCMETREIATYDVIRDFENKKVQIKQNLITEKKQAKCNRFAGLLWVVTLAIDAVLVWKVIELLF